MEEVGICVYSSEDEQKSSKGRQRMRVPIRLRYPFRLLSPASKDNG